MRKVPILTVAAFLLACGGGEPAPGTGGNTVGKGPGEMAPPRNDAPVSPVGDSATQSPDPTAQAEWGTSVRSGSGAAGQVVLQDVRVAAHRDGGYDRFVLEFSGGLPDWTIQYPSAPLHQCGSGRPIQLDASTALQITLRSAAAHDQQGNATVRQRTLEPELQMLRSARLTCDFEGEVEWVLGLAGRTPFRVMALDDPSRLVVDVQR